MDWNTLAGGNIEEGGFHCRIRDLHGERFNHRERTASGFS
jgi:hypothetical protein